MSGESAVLRFDDVSLYFGDTPALVHVSFEMGAGETRVVLGASGSGKTMLLKTALGLVKPDSGRIYLFGQDISGLKESDLFDIRSKVGVLFQEGGLFDSMTIGENVAYPLLNQRALYKDRRQPANGNVEERVREALRFVELEQTLDKVPSELSGGMRRRVGIARAVVTEPPLVLYDSPTAGLDPITAHTIIALLIKERDVSQATTLVVTQRYQDGNLIANFRYNSEQGSLEPNRGGVQRDLRTTFMVLKEGRLIFEGVQDELEASKDSYICKFVKPRV